MGSDTGMGLIETTPPRRLSRWVDRFTPDELKALAKKLESGNWLSDETEICESRSQAYYRAEALIEALTHLGIERYRFHRRTWPVGGGQRWAIRLRKE